MGFLQTRVYDVLAPAILLLRPDQTTVKTSNLCRLETRLEHGTSTFCIQNLNISKT